MTLQELFNIIAEHPQFVLFYFAIVPLAALILGSVSGGEGHLSPWKYVYAVLIYLASIPGIFSVTLDVYLFLFEKQPIMETDIYTQIFPIISMVATLLIIRRNVDLDWIPGFDKLSGLITMITAAMLIMWFVDKTRIVIFSYLRFEYVLVIFLLLFLIIRFGWSRFIGKGKRRRPQTTY